MSSVFIKVPVSERLPNMKIENLGVINIHGYHESIQYNNAKEDNKTLTDSCEFWLEEIELPEEEYIRQYASELAQEGVYNIGEIDAYVDGFNHFLEELKGGNNG